MQEISVGKLLSTMQEATEKGWLSKDDASSFFAALTSTVSELERKIKIAEAQSEALKKRADAYAEAAKNERATADAMLARAEGMRDAVAVAILSAEGYVTAARRAAEEISQAEVQREQE